MALVANVAYPDERLGERDCTVVVPKPGLTLDMHSMVAYLKEQKVVIQFIPVRLEVRQSMPSTPSGKIQKLKL